MIGNAIFFTCLEMFKTIIYNKYYGNKAYDYITKYEKLLYDSSIVFLSKIICDTITNPLLIMKSRLEACSSEIETNLFKNIYKI